MGDEEEVCALEAEGVNITALPMTSRQRRGEFGNEGEKEARRGSAERQRGEEDGVRCGETLRGRRRTTCNLLKHCREEEASSFLFASSLSKHSSSRSRTTGRRGRCFLFG